MIGSMLASTKEAPGELVWLEGRRWKKYRGMGSIGAMKSSQASRERYRHSGKSPFVAEGVEGMVLYTGPVGEMLIQLAGGLRAGMGYVGAGSIAEMREKADFDRITAAGKAEAHPHGVTITEEPPNYRGR